MYNFQNLEPREFELLCRDLMQAYLSREYSKPIYLESFKEGKDGGIDFRGCFDSELLVLQVKRYQNFQDLKSQLKNKEIHKVKKLAPKRYILLTSLGLNPNDKNEILNIFTPYLQNTIDVFGQNDLNNLLVQFPEIEKTHYKLYLSSINILEKIIHNAINYESKSKLQKIKDNAKYYVKHQNFDLAMNILNANRFVVISGDAGVGKSTLANELALFFIAKENYQFIFVRGAIREAKDVFCDGKKQIFLFDDFLGYNHFNGFNRNEEYSLVDFIEDVSDSQDKYLIITTREYILQQGIREYPILEKINYTKSLIQQKVFDTEFRAAIFYNYLNYSNISYSTLESLIYSKDDIIYHRNFSPRIISEFFAKFVQKENSYAPFELKEYLNNPYTYWKNVFTTLSKPSQALLLLLVTFEEPIVYHIAFESFKNLTSYRELSPKGYEVQTFESAIAEITESFISLVHNPDADFLFKETDHIDLALSMGQLSKAKIIEFQNPSIKDFLVNYLSKYPDWIEHLIQSFVVFNQFFFIFNTNNDKQSIYDENAVYNIHSNKIPFTEPQKYLVINKIVKDFDNLYDYELGKSDYDEDKSAWIVNEGCNFIQQLRLLTYYFDLEIYPKLREFILAKFRNIFYDTTSHDDIFMYYKIKEIKTPTTPEHRQEYPYLLKKLLPYLEIDAHKEIANFFQSVRFASDMIALYNFSEIFPTEFQSFVKSNRKKIKDKIEFCIYDDIDFYLGELGIDANHKYDNLIDVEVDELAELYGIKYSKKFKKAVNSIADDEVFYLEPITKVEQIRNITEKVTDTEDRENVEDIKEELNFRDLLPNDDNLEIDEEAILSFLQTEFQDNYLCEKATELLIKEKIIGEWRENHYWLELVCEYIKNKGLNFIDKVDFYSKLLAFVLENQTVGETNQIQNFLLHFALSCYGRETFIMNRKTILDYIKMSLLFQKLAIDGEEMLKWLLEIKILVELKEDKWYCFSKYDFQVWLVASQITNLAMSERQKIYQSIDTMYYYRDNEYLWELLFTLDKKVFISNHLLPKLKEFVNQLDKGNLIYSYFKINDVKLDFEVGKNNELSLSTLFGSSISEEAIAFFEIYFDFWGIGDCFEEIYNNTNTNEKDIANQKMLQDYLKTYCVKDKQNGIFYFEMNFSENFKKKEFLYILEITGVVEYVKAGYKSVCEKIKELEALT
jgi:energy-coupling factor transporter ATP-binding protein EcfA2